MTKLDILVWVPDSLLGQIESRLCDLNLRWEAACSFREALRLLSSAPRIVITLLDPEGYDLLRTARAYYPNTQTILIKR